MWGSGGIEGESTGVWAIGQPIFGGGEGSREPKQGWKELWRQKKEEEVRSRQAGM